MTSIRAIAIAGAALVASGLAANAADLYGGRGSIKDDYAQAPAAYGGCPSWYARVDGGYSSFDKPVITAVNVDDYLRPNIKDTWSVGGGIGRYFTCNVRGDITVDHRFNTDVTGKNGNIFSPGYGEQKWGMESTAVLANLYYDFDTRSRFTPYIGVGLGFTQNEISRGAGVVGNEMAFGSAGNPIAVGGNSGWHAAAALMTGVSIALRDRVALDAGYRFLYLGQFKTGNIADTVSGGIQGPSRIDEVHAHEFRVGLRFDFGSNGPGCCAGPAPLK